MKKTKQEEQVPELEKNKEYNKETIDISKCHYKDIDDDFEYLKNNWFYSAFGFVVRGLIKLYVPIHDFFAYQLKIKGKENLKKVKGQGIIGICNHSQLVDIAISRKVFYSRRYYTTSALFNNKSGMSGKILKAVGSLPISPKLSAQIKLNEAIKTIISRKQVVMFYPEKAMWKNYRKPRPFMKGAFYYAVKCNAPIVPIIVLYRQTNKIDKFFGRKNKLIAKILEPIYPNMDLPERDRTQYMLEKAQWIYNQEYKKFYGEENDATIITNPDENLN